MQGRKIVFQRDLRDLKVYIKISICKELCTSGEEEWKF